MTFPTVDSRQVRHHFSEHAGEYDLYARVQKRVAARLVGMALEQAVSGPVLDVGTGTGDVARRLSGSWGGSPVVVSDLAHEMTRTAQANLPFSLAADGDARALPFRDECFGLVLSSSVFQWVDDLALAFSECRRVLRPGGTFAFAMFCEGTLWELRETFRSALASTGSNWPFHFQSFPARDVIENAVFKAGFPSAECRIEIEKEDHPSFRDLMVGLKRIGAQNASRSRPAGLFPRQVLLEMSRIYARDYRSEAGVSASYGVAYGIVQK